MLVRDHMTPDPITLGVDTDFKSALQLMEDRAIHHLPVIDGRGRVVGVITETDVFRAFVGTLRRSAAPKPAARTAAAKHPGTAKPSAPKPAARKKPTPRGRG